MLAKSAPAGTLSSPDKEIEMSLIDPETVGRYVESGWWGTDPLHRLVREQAARTPDADAYITPSARTSW
ncbi:acyl--CoA ligase, partial [Mannheimia haemolytica]